VFFSLQTMSETFIVRRYKQDFIINEHTSLSKVTVTIVRFSLKLKFIKRFLKYTQVLIFKNFVLL
jgi:hypothetical protein